jgi:hypothetical protein
MNQSCSSLFHGSAELSSLYPKMRMALFLQSGGTDSDDPHQSISMTATSVRGHGLGNLKCSEKSFHYIPMIVVLKSAVAFSSILNHHNS